MADPAKVSEHYDVRRISLDEIERRAVSGQQSASQFPMQDPEWVKGYFADQRKNLSTYSLSRSGDSSGTASFLLLDWPFTWHLGEFAISDLPLNRLLLLDGSIDIPQDGCL